ncbi:hypothetical protein D3C77_629430 [compost metagenome]
MLEGGLVVTGREIERVLVFVVPSTVNQPRTELRRRRGIDELVRPIAWPRAGVFKGNVRHIGLGLSAEQPWQTAP